MKKKTKKTIQKRIIKQSIICTTTVLLIVLLNIVVFKNKMITPKLDEITTSYVSLYNLDTTDMLKITNIEKMSEKKGNSKLNNKSISFTVTSENKEEYVVILYEIQSDIPTEYIRIAVDDNKKTTVSSLDKFEKKDDGGRIIYTGKANKNNIKIKMWVSEKYKDKVNDTSFEMRIKKR